VPYTARARVGMNYISAELGMRIVDSGVAQRALNTDRSESSRRIEGPGEAHDRIQFEQPDSNCRIIEIDLSALKLLEEVRRQGIHVHLKPDGEG